jgi:hypothetical protein
MRDLRFGVIGIGTLAACIALGGGVARADLTANFVSATPVVGGFDWTYSIGLDNIQKINPPPAVDFVTVYDFGPNTLVSGPANFAYSSTLTNTPAFQTQPFDNPNILNVRFTYTGSLVIMGPSALGSFTLFSPNGPSRIVSDDGQAFQISDGLPRGNVSTTIAPVPVPVVGAGLPGLVAACGGLLALARRRRRQQIA